MRSMTLCKSVQVERTILKKVNGSYGIYSETTGERVNKKSFPQRGATYRDSYVIQEAMSEVITLLGAAKKRDITSLDFIGEFKNLLYTLQADTYKMRSIMSTVPYSSKYCINFDDLVIRPDMGGRMSINILVPFFNRLNSECNKRMSIGGGPFDSKYVNVDELECLVCKYLMPYMFHLNGTSPTPLYHILPTWAISVGGRVHVFDEDTRRKHHMGNDCHALILLPSYINFILNKPLVWSDDIMLDRTILPPTPRQPIVLMDVDAEYPVMEKLDPYEPRYEKGCVRYGIPIGDNISFPKDM